MPCKQPPATMSCPLHLCCTNTFCSKGIILAACLHSATYRKAVLPCSCFVTRLSKPRPAPLPPSSPVNLLQQSHCLFSAYLHTATYRKLCCARLSKRPCQHLPAPFLTCQPHLPTFITDSLPATHRPHLASLLPLVSFAPQTPPT